MLKLRHIKLKYILEGQDTPIEKRKHQIEFRPNQFKNICINYGI